MATRAPSAFSVGDFDADHLLGVKGRTRISVCVPARDEEGTVGAVVRAVVEELVGPPCPLVDEVLVVDDASTDGTAEVARAAGARVVRAADVLPRCGPGAGKGEALWKSLAACGGDLVAWCDADVVGFDPSFVVGLLGPLLTDRRIGFVKARYGRPLAGGVDGGGRVTELVARPLIALLFPHLAPFAQPLAGECAGRRSVLERVPFAQGYGVDLGLLVDLAATIGVGAMAEVDLGVRVHRNRPLPELSPEALAVLGTALGRAGLEPAPGRGGPSTVLAAPGRAPVWVGGAERPPLVDVPGYRARAGPAPVG
ncbi:MAG: glucosyl-3-phosphoglycerate synthase, partial [Acidimicrobiales bacterium]